MRPSVDPPRRAPLPCPLRVIIEAGPTAQSPPNRSAPSSRPPSPPVSAGSAACLRMDSADLGIWVDRKKREDVVRDLTFLRLADGRPPRSQAREACRRAALTESEPDRRRPPKVPLSGSVTLLKVIRQRFSTPCQRRQCGSVTLRTLVTPGSDFPAFQELGRRQHAQRARISPRPSAASRTISAA